MSKLDELLQELCPNGVKFRPLDKCCIILDSKRKPVTKALRKSGIYPYYGANGIQDHISEYIYDGTFILIGEDGSVITPNGTPVVTWASGKIWVNNHAHVLSESTDVSLRYLFHFIQTINIAPLVHGNIPKLTGSDLRAISIPVPPLEVQREIVHILDSFTNLTAELSAKLSAELSARQKQYGFYREKLLNHKYQINYVPLGELAQFSYGYTEKAQDTGDTRFIRITDITDDGCLNPNGAKYITLSEDSRKHLLNRGDLLLARTGATYGKTLYMSTNEPAVYASFLIKISLDNTRLLNRFYWHFSKSQSYWNQAEKLVSKGGQQQFNANAVSRIIVPVPPLDVQQRIVNVLDNFDAICSDLNIGLPAEISARQKQYEYYRDLLLSFKNIDNITDRQTEHN